jgi:uncharacterized protein YkwD
MRRRTILAALGGAGATIWYLGGQPPADEPATGDAKAGSGGDGSVDVATAPDRKAVEATIVDRINTARFDRGIPNLGRDSDLRLTAREHSKDMHARDFYGHKNPDGEQPWHRAPCNAAETIHRGNLGSARNRGAQDSWDTTTAKGMAGYVVEGWVLSDEHYEIMLTERYTRIGVGVHIADGQFWATAMFCER